MEDEHAEKNGNDRETNVAPVVGRDGHGVHGGAVTTTSAWSMGTTPAVHATAAGRYAGLAYLREVCQGAQDRGI